MSVKDVRSHVVGISLGTLCMAIGITWTALGIGRPVFMADLIPIQAEQLSMRESTTLQFLLTEQRYFRTELRKIVRELRSAPDDAWLLDELARLEEMLKELDTKIACVRATTCTVNI